MSWALLLWVPLGLLAAFFVVFQGVFTDGPASLWHPERLVAYLVTLIVYGGGAALGARLGGTWWHAWLALVAPAAAFLTWYWTREPGTVLLGLVYLLVIAVAVYGGLELGARWHGRVHGTPLSATDNEEE